MVNFGRVGGYRLDTIMHVTRRMFKQRASTHTDRMRPGSICIHRKGWGKLVRRYEVEVRDGDVEEYYVRRKDRKRAHEEI